ncbi:MAG: hypothetical protein HQK65_20580, partial [Desulfamplus sp.]|nr:hypothetical protein [Desulfamplus sp.]
SKIPDMILFTSDDEEILSKASELPGVITDRRPDQLAGSVPSMWDVVGELLSRRMKEFAQYQDILILSPCHPFRTGKHLSQAMELYRNKKALALMSITPYPCSPAFALSVKNQLIQRNWNGLVRSSEQPEAFYPNGAITILRRHVLDNYGGPFTEKTLAFELPWPYCLDIDT